MKCAPAFSRRDALKIAAAATVPMILPARLFGNTSPSKQVTLGIIGIGWQGGGNLGQFLGNPDCRVLACWRRRRRATSKVRWTTSSEHYGKGDCGL